MKIGILGGGQLGRMLLQEGANYPLHFKVLDPDPHAPCASLCADFVCGDFRDRETVLNFGLDCDAIGIEIEHVNVEALFELKAMGKRIVPDPEVLAMIQDKGAQKLFYKRHDIASLPFCLAEGRAQARDFALPFVQKTRRDGYDGRGVQRVLSVEDLEGVWDCPSVFEALCDLECEVAVVFARDALGNVRLYPMVEMVFDPLLNLVGRVRMPSFLPKAVQEAALDLALQVAKAVSGAGLFAVEMFVDKKGKVWVNETACRVHNSGHLTIEACNHSQFDLMLRLLAGYPLPELFCQREALMVNMIGADGAFGLADTHFLEKVLMLPEVYVHWYGKREVRAGRKMGHITLCATSAALLEERLEALEAVFDGKVWASKEV